MDAYKVHMKLTIRRIGLADYGSYKCLAKNSLGSTDGTIKLYRNQISLILFSKLDYYSFSSFSSFFFELAIEMLKSWFDFVQYKCIFTSFLIKKSKKKKNRIISGTINRSSHLNSYYFYVDHSLKNSLHFL